MTTLTALRSLIAEGESETLELKRSTAELKRAGETLYALLNGEGGQVLIGVGPDGKHPRQQAGASARVRDGPRGDLVARPDAAAVRAVPEGRHQPRGPAAGARGGAARDRHQRRHPPRREQPELVRRHRRLRRPHRDPQHRDFPTGIRAELLTQEHRSIPQDPLIAGAFHRTGAIEVWGRGTNRVIEACRAYGLAEPTFTEGAGAVTVTFTAEVVAGTRDLAPRRQQVGSTSAASPDKPRSSKQQYRITEAGRALLRGGS